MYDDHLPESKGEKIAKDIGKKAARKTGQAIKNAAKKAFKAIIKAIGIKGLAIALIILIVIFFGACAWYARKQSIQDAIVSITKDLTFQTGEISSITVIDEKSRTISINSDELKNRLDNWFKESYIDKNSIGLSDDYHELNKFLEAEIVTLYPDLRNRDKIGTELAEGELQGTVQFNRKYSDGTEQLLEYMPYSEFAQKVACLGIKLDEKQTQDQIYFSKLDVESKYNELKSRFTLDEYKNLIVLGMYSSETTVFYSDYAKEEGKQDGEGNTYTFNIDVKRVNYQDVIDKYSLPLEFCTALLMTTDNDEFCEAVADLAKNSKIIIDIQDNQTTDISVESYNYMAEFWSSRFLTYQEYINQKPLIDTSTGKQRVDSNGKPIFVDNYGSERAYDPNPINEYKTYDASKYKTETVVTSYNNIELCVSYVDTWIANYNSVYENALETKENTSEYSEKDKEFTTISTNYHNIPIPSATLPENAKIVKDTTTRKERNYNIKTTYQFTTKSNKYSKVSSTVKETPEKFLSLLRIDPNTGVYDLYNNRNNTKLIGYNTHNQENSSPVDNLLNAREFLSQLLLSSSRTVMLDDTMKYLMALYEGTTKLDTSRYSLYDPGSFTPIFNGSSGLTGIQGQIYDFLLSKGMSSVGAAAIMGNIQRESSFRTDASNGTHFGLCQWGGGRWSGLTNYAKSKGCDWTDLNAQLEYLWSELEGKYSGVKNALMNATELEGAVRYFCEKFEVCGSYSTEVPIRLRYAQYWYDEASKNIVNTDHSGVSDVTKYQLNIYKGFIEYKQFNYKKIPPSYKATSESAGTIKDKGCMPTSISILLSGLGVKDSSGNAYTPETLITSGAIANLAGGSSTLGNAKNTFAKFGFNVSGLKYTNTSNAINDMKSSLNDGNLLLVHSYGNGRSTNNDAPGYYTSGGHYMTILAIQGDQVYLSNPSSNTKNGWVPLNTLIKRGVDWYAVVYRH